MITTFTFWCGLGTEPSSELSAGSLALRTKGSEHLCCTVAVEQEAKAAPGQKHTKMFIPTRNLPHTLLPVRIRAHVTVAKPFKCHWLSTDY